MKVKTEDLTGPALDWAVAKCAEWPMDVWYDEDELPMIRDDEVPEWKPSASWAQGGPIIEQEKFKLHCGDNNIWWSATNQNPHRPVSGPTPLIAAMRCYVRTEMGDEIEVPDELF
jgi:hypothetical protein